MTTTTTTKPETAFIDGRLYTVERMDDRFYPRHLEQGWDGYAYLLTGKRGARKLAYWSVAAGRYVVIC